MPDPIEKLKQALRERYAVERELGQGGMATVYLAEDLRHNRKVAIKVLRPELAAVLGADRFVQEITTTARLQHPNILPLFDSGSADGFLYYVMPYVEGETLRAKLNRETQLGVDESVKLVSEVADALQYAHTQGVVHRDIKPENILLHAGRPLVADFGIALAVSAAAGGRMTETGLSLGTPHYMSPEQATAEKHITNRSDVYSLGAVLYEMLTGNPPHTGSSAQQIIMKIIAEPIAAVTELRKTVPRNVAAALGKALEKVPADRFETAKAFAEALANPAFTLAAASGSAAAAAQTFRHNRPALVFAAIAVLLAMLAAWGWLRPERPPTVARYRLAIPPDQALQMLRWPQFALALNGSWLVYVGPGSGGEATQLWVKARDRLEATPLEGTAGARSPSVSPDGHQIAFTVGGTLRTVPAGGGSATTIADSTYPSGGGVWLDDRMVAYLDDRSRLRRVPAAGGASEVVYDPEPLHYAIPVAGLPDGRGILFLNCSASCTPTSDLSVTDGPSGKARQLLPDVAWAAYLEGRLLFVRRDGGMFGVPFDPDKLALQGGPVPLFEGVRVDVGAHVTLAASGELAYVAGAATGGAFEAMWVSRDGRAVPVDTAWSFQLPANPGWALSPDGKRLAIGLRTGGNEDIWIKDLDRGPASRLTFSDASDFRPRWTPDGRAVTFISNRLDRENHDLWVRRADGTGTDSLVLHLQEQIEEAVWSPGHQWLILRTGGLAGQQNQRDILALRVGQDTLPRPLLTAPYDEAVPALSPDGRWLAYESGEAGRREIFVRPFPNVETGKWQLSTSGGTSPVWAHSGRELFFVNGKQELVSQAVVPGAIFQRGEQRVLFGIGGSYRLSANYATFDVSPDDQRFLMLQQKGTGAGQGPELIVVENWMEEVKRAMKGR